MAHASGKQFGRGAKGKNDASGAASRVDVEDIPENAPLSNRDETLGDTHAGGRDGRWTKSQQRTDHPENRHPRDRSGDD
ncbi:hypothetical protein [Frigidibacter sp. MR17.24]|uniref:hypothetical protein n=1 Tax=Frigidibacter sp. MR17.24 TaxID=3127345 RepID=UPI003012C811